MRICASSSPGEVRIAVTGHDVLLDFALWRPDMADGVGDIYRARVSAHVPALGGTFITLPGLEQAGFLPDSEGLGPLTQGQTVLVTITRSAQGGKGVRLGARNLPPDLPGGSEPGLLRRGPTPLEQLARQYPDAPILIDDATIAAMLPAALHPRLTRVTSAFDSDLRAKVDALEDPVVSLPGGMSASITPTPALVAIDMDGGATSMDRRPKQTAQFAANRDALPDLLRQLRLRNLSGAIIVDVAGLAIRKRRALAETVETLLKDDPLRPRFLGFTALGLAEIVRPRVHPPLHELFHSREGQLLRDLRAQMQAYRGMPPNGRPVTLACGHGIMKLLQDHPDWMADFVRLTGRVLQPVMAQALPANGWRFDHD
ncbi:ribonuclease E/G [Komagataeibacter sp. FNDCF1]|uniref:ribonuclease E/G n=1 Tax=Komagataeibacter sp. FNDCF1 TaxID=2878681 RepID=UPI001E5AE1C2|nr:ribonuclease E/G [Komagataeibacter sp. FNDCF1]MCE2564889.1 ribonuclease E/G [Komagataeibacter sp. FNDCF1]